MILFLDARQVLSPWRRAKSKAAGRLCEKEAEFSTAKYEFVCNLNMRASVFFSSPPPVEVSSEGEVVKWVIGGREKEAFYVLSNVSL